MCLAFIQRYSYLRTKIGLFLFTRNPSQFLFGSLCSSCTSIVCFYFIHIERFWTLVNDLEIECIPISKDLCYFVDFCGNIKDSSLRSESATNAEYSFNVLTSFLLIYIRISQNQKADLEVLRMFGEHVEIISSYFTPVSTFRRGKSLNFIIN